MSDTLASLRRKIDGAGDLESVVRSMKALAAASIGQYEKSVLALADYYRTVELGLVVCLRKRGAVAEPAGRSGTATKTVCAIVFGSDQGLVGQFNDVLADFVAKALAALPGEKKVWAVGDRVHARLADAGLAPVGLFAVPTSVNAITPLVGQILVESEAHHGQGEIGQLYLFHNRPRSGAAYEPVSQQPAAPGCAMGTPAGPSPLADQKPARGHRVPGADAVGTRPGVSFCFALQGLRRIVGQRKREPPGRHATSREKHRRTGGNA